MLGFVPSKTPEFLCFQSIQAPKSTTMLKSFLLSFGTFLLAFLHHSAKVCSLLLGIHHWKQVMTILETKNLLWRRKMLGGVEWSHPLDHKGGTDWVYGLKTKYYKHLSYKNKLQQNRISTSFACLNICWVLHNQLCFISMILIHVALQDKYKDESFFTGYKDERLLLCSSINTDGTAWVKSNAHIL
jgi:hypothetical protein